MTTSVWVASAGTNVGKTTIATALVEELVDRGTSALAFKPFGATRLRLDLDFLLKEVPEGRLYGRGAVELSQCSPLTRDEIPELIAPCYVLAYQYVRHALLVRCGVPAFGTARIYSVRSAADALERSDIKRILSRKGWTSDVSGELEEFGIQDAGRVFAKEISESYDRLMKLEPQTIVSEGAGPYLPLWPGQPQPRNVVLVQPYHLILMSDISRDILSAYSAEAGPRLTAPLEFARRYAADVETIPFPVAEPGRIRKTARAIACDLVHRMG